MGVPLTLYMVPGSGTDRRMYTPQLEQLEGIVVLDWLPPRHLREPLPAYAERLAETIDTSAPFVLGGVSLGGMLAQQMALQLKPMAVIVIASCSDTRGRYHFRRV